MNSRVQETPPHVQTSDGSFNVAVFSRNYGVMLGLTTAFFLIILNLLTGERDVPLGLRFAKHLIIIPFVWFAVSSYAVHLPEGRAFKKELGMLGRVAAWSAITITLANILFFAFTFTSFEQFMQEGETLLGVMINSGFLIFETLVFVMTIGFVILQAYKGQGSPDD